MNKNGMYSALVALVAVIMVSVLLINSHTAVMAENIDFANETVKMKSKMQNLRDILDDVISEVFCSEACQQFPNYASTEKKIKEVIKEFGDKTGLNCNAIGNMAIENNEEFPVNIQCSKELGNFSISYKKTFYFKKNAFAQTDDKGNCIATVTDDYSGISMNC